MSCCHAQECYLKEIDEILDMIKEFKLPESYAENFSDMRADIKERELLIPVIGHFSAGKSAMLNSLMNSNILPVGIRPETTMATELRYSSSENIIAWDSADCTPHNFAMTEFGSIISQPAKWLYISLGLSCNTLRDIEPLILVDMPGFNSPIEQHSKAISLYLDRGAFYIVLVPANEGTIDRSILLQLNLISTLGRKFAVFVSKSDLKTPKELETITKHIQSIIQEEFGITCPVATISENNVSAIMDALKYADPENLFKSIYQEKFDEKINSLIGNIRTELNSLSRSTDNLSDTMNKLKESLHAFESKTEDEIRHMRTKFSGNMVSDIVNKTGSTLSLHAEEIAEIVISGDVQGAQQFINNIVQFEVISQIEQKFGDLSVSITTELASSLKPLDATLKEFSIDPNFIKNICDSVQKILSFCDTGRKGSVNTSSLVALGSTMSAAATTATTMAAGTTGTVLGFSLGVAVPVIGAVVAALPLILTPIYEKYKKEQLREDIINKLRTVVFPTIKSKLRIDLPAKLNSQIENMINGVRNEFKTALKRKEEAVAEAMNLKQQEKETVDKRIAELETVLQALLKKTELNGER